MNHPKQITIPIPEAVIRNLRVGDSVLLNGTIYTGRDSVHRYLAHGGTLPAGVDLTGGVIYHCGPVMVRDAAGQWQCYAAGPTTSIRHEPYQAAVLERCGLRGIIGKGGMGNDTRAACRTLGAVYFHALGGAAQILAGCVKKVIGVWFLDEFGPAEAMWALEVEDFPAVVTIDATGASLHQQIADASSAALMQILGRDPKPRPS